MLHIDGRHVYCRHLFALGGSRSGALAARTMDVVSQSCCDIPHVDLFLTVKDRTATWAINLPMHTVAPVHILCIAYNPKMYSTSNVHISPF